MLTIKGGGRRDEGYVLEFSDMIAATRRKASCEYYAGQEERGNLIITL